TALHALHCLSATVHRVQLTLCGAVPPDRAITIQTRRGDTMDLYTLVDHVVDLLRQRQRVTYRALQRQFDLDEETLNDLKDELLSAHEAARDEDERVLVWTGAPAAIPPLGPAAAQPTTPVPQDVAPRIAAPGGITPQTPEAERRQLTVLFCDL